MLHSYFREREKERKRKREWNRKRERGKERKKERSRNSEKHVKEIGMSFLPSLPLSPSFASLSPSGEKRERKKERKRKRESNILNFSSFNPFFLSPSSSHPYRKCFSCSFCPFQFVFLTLSFSLSLSISLSFFLFLFFLTPFEPNGEKRKSTLLRKRKKKMGKRKREE